MPQIIKRKTFWLPTLLAAIIGVTLYMAWHAANTQKAEAALVLADRVRESSTTTGTGTFDLDGATTGFQTFVAGIGDGNTCYYCIQLLSAGEWEVGIGTVTDASPDTLARTTVLRSSASDAKVSFSAGTKDVFVTYPADKSVFEDAASNVTLPGDLVLTAGDVALSADDKEIQFGADVDYTIDWDGDDAVHTIAAGQFLFSGGNVGINQAAPDGTLHVHTATAGSVVADGAADDLVVENSAAGGTSVLIPDNAAGQLAFGTPSDNYGAFLSWHHNNDLLTLATHNAGASLVFGTAVGTTALTLQSDQDAQLAANLGVGVSPSHNLHILTAGSEIISDAVANVGIVVEAGTGSAALNIITPNSEAGVINFGDPEDSNAGFISYSHSSNIMSLGTNAATTALSLEADQDALFAGNVGIGRSPTTHLDLFSTGNTTVTIHEEVTGVAASTRTLSLIDFTGLDDADAVNTFARIQVNSVDAAAGSEDGSLLFKTSNAGTTTLALTLESDQDALFAGKLLAGGSLGEVSVVNIKANAAHFGMSIEENSGPESWQLGVDVDGDLNFFDSAGGTPFVQFADGTGEATFASNADIEGYAAIGNGSALNSVVALLIDYNRTSSTGTQLQVLGDVEITSGSSDLQHILGYWGGAGDGVKINSGGTHTHVASMQINEPNIDVSAANGTVTNAYSLYIPGAPSEGTGANWGAYITGDAHVTGEFTAGTKTFVIDHPVDPQNKDLVFMATESPDCLVEFNGRVKLVNGTARVNIDTACGLTVGTFDALTKDATAEVVSLNAYDTFDRVKCTKITDNQFMVTCENATATHEVAWLVKAERDDAFIRAAKKTDADGNLINEPDKRTPLQQELDPIPEYVEDDNQTGTEDRIEPGYVQGVKGFERHPEAFGKPKHTRRVNRIKGGAITGTIWEDTNQDGVKDDGEPGIQGLGVTVTLAGAKVQGGQSRTDVDGNYVIKGLDPGDYTVAIAGLSNATTATEEIHTVVAGRTYTTNFGEYIPNATITGTVWEDENNDGIKDDEEPGIEGISVTTGETTVTTDVNGGYAFSGLNPGTHTVSVSGLAFPSTPTSVDVTAVVNDSVTQDFGEYLPNCVISGTVWDDVNGDGVEDQDESGITGAIVAVGEATATTDENGDYSFTGLAPAEYTATVTIPEGYQATTATDVTGTIAATETLTADFGIQVIPE